MPNQKSPLDLACNCVGSQSALAVLLKVSPPTVNQWVKGSRPVPIEHCTAIEQATGGVVKRWDLRPDDWHRIWPELSGTEGAPKVPKAPAINAQAATETVAGGL